MLHIARSNICTEFDERTVGTKVTDPYNFTIGLHAAVLEHSPDFDVFVEEPERQAVIELDEYFPLPTEEVVSAGVGCTEDGYYTRDDYVLRNYRGEVKKYLKREHAAPVESCRAVVYTKEGYLQDPDTGEAEAARIERLDPDFVLITVLADAGPDESPMSPGRLVHNLAGGNNAVESWSKQDIIDRAKEAVDYYDKWHVVAD